MTSLSSLPLPPASACGRSTYGTCSRTPAVAWFEVHSENYFADAGRTSRRSTASAPITRWRCTASACRSAPRSARPRASREAEASRRARRARDRLEHLCWSGIGGRHFNDLLPLPYTDEALARVCARIDEVQAYLGRALVVENVSSYYAFPEATIPEHEFVAAIALRTGCRLLVDVNNIHVNARNHGIDPMAFLDAMPRAAVARSTSRATTTAARSSSTRTARRSRPRCGRSTAPRWPGSAACPR